jgi:serine/threonine protein kinase
MPITDVFVLPKDVLLIPVTELPAPVREKLSFKEGDLAITRPHVRAPSKIIGASAATLLKQFEQPKTIVAAVLDFSHQAAADPEKVLEQALPLLKNLIDSRVLLEANSPGAEQIAPTLSPGDTFAGYEIVDTVHVVEDTEVYHARVVTAPETIAALKLARPKSGIDLTATFEREATVLRHLDGHGAPKLLDSGVHDDRRFLAMEWIFGVPVPVLAGELHQALTEAAGATSPAETQVKLQDLVARIAESYAALHARGVVHSDVHANNLLVRESGEISIIDFGYARFLDSTHALASAPRAGVGFYFEPECATAMLTGQAAPPSSVLGEQYSVAAIIYQLLTGATHLDFSLQYEEMLRQIAHSDPRPWSLLDVAPWPEMEQVVARALSRDPSQRYPSMQAFADSLRAVSSTMTGDERADSAAVASASETPTASLPSAFTAFIDRTLQRLQPSEPLFASAIGPGTLLPTASANHGAAGIAFAILRLACRRGDPQLLALADLWITKTIADARGDEAFYNEALEITRDTVSEISLHHMPSGVFFVRTLVSLAMGDVSTAQGALQGFVESAHGEPDNLDLTLGRASVLHGAALLIEQGRHYQGVDLAPLQSFGNETMTAIWNRLSTFGAVQQSEEMTYLGAAHGWAGVLYSTLKWCQANALLAGEDAQPLLPQTFTRRLLELSECGSSSGRGLFWPWFNSRSEGRSESGYMPGWCNGNAGHVLLWTLAHEVFNEPRYLDLARKAGWGVVEQRVHFNNLCCGATGCAYAMLALYRRTGDATWLTHARRFADRVATIPDMPPEHPTDVDSLYKGDIGPMILLDELADPLRARMPLVE